MVYQIIYVYKIEYHVSINQKVEQSSRFDKRGELQLSYPSPVYSSHKIAQGSSKTSHDCEG